MPKQRLILMILVLMMSTACMLQPIEPSIQPFSQSLTAPIVESPDVNKSQHPINAGFTSATHADGGVEIALSGFDISEMGEQLTLYWQARAQPTSDYVAFVHLISSAGELVAQIDQVPDVGLPTSQWQPDHQAEDRYTLDLAHLTPGNYLVVAGLYDQPSGLRLHTTHWNAVTLVLLTIREVNSVVTIGPDCQSDGDRFRCHDAVLGADFVYPLEWGVVESELRPGGYAGTIYTYRFKPDTEFIPFAGGLSADFSEGRGGWYTDFKGYEHGDAAQVCVNYSAVYCEQISTNVLFMIIDAPVRFLCEQGPATLHAPMVAVALNLASTRPIQGFIMLSHFLGDNQVKQLHDIVGFDGNSAAHCNEETEATYNATMQQIIAEVQDGTSDPETLRAYRAMLDLAKSVVSAP